MELYREDLMDIYKNPSHKGTVDDPSVKVFEKNPMCGDEIDLSVKVKNGVIEDIKFEGSACSVSIISSDLLLDHVKGKTIEEAKKITKDDLLKMVDINLTTSRVKCATLILVAVQEAITKLESKDDNKK
jgi:nitrogen fixation NifU-like protein